MRILSRLPQPRPSHAHRQTGSARGDYQRVSRRLGDQLPAIRHCGSGRPWTTAQAGSDTVASTMAAGLVQDRPVSGPDRLRSDERLLSLRLSLAE